MHGQQIINSSRWFARKLIRWHDFELLRVDSQASRALPKKTSKRFKPSQFEWEMICRCCSWNNRQQFPLSKIFILETKTKVESHIHERILKASSFTSYVVRHAYGERFFLLFSYSACIFLSICMSPAHCSWTEERSSAAEISDRRWIAFQSFDFSFRVFKSATSIPHEIKWWRIRHAQ